MRFSVEDHLCLLLISLFCNRNREGERLLVPVAGTFIVILESFRLTDIKQVYQTNVSSERWEASRPTGTPRAERRDAKVLLSQRERRRHRRGDVAGNREDRERGDR